MVASKAIVIELDGARHEAGVIGDIASLLMQLAREAKAAKESVDRTSEQQRLVEARRRLGVALFQLHTQVPHGSWYSLLVQIGGSVGMSLHTLKKCARMAAKLTESGEWNLETIGKARKLLAETAVRRLEKRKSNSALAHQSIREADGYENEDGDLPPRSMYEAERLCRAIDDEDHDFEEPDPIVIDDPVKEVGAVGAEQMTFSACFEAAGAAVDRAVEACERELLAVADGFGEAAGRLASKFRDAADRIERKVAEVTDG